ncbi:MAG: hypothetical protein IJ105_02290 [Bacilli bacterium]|nr:hypothetical protein [Bacilli bacterium]
MKKQSINELLKYTNSKKIIRLVFLYNDEDLLNKIIEIYKKLYNTNRTDSEKSDLIMYYVKNRKKEHIEYLIYNFQITNYFTYEEQKEFIKKFISGNLSYEQIVNNCYIRCMNNEIIKEKEEEKPKKEHKTDKKIDKSAYPITSNQNVLKYRSNEEIYDLIKVYYKDENGLSIKIILNENVLKRRNNYEQIELIKLYLYHQCDEIYNLIVNLNILKYMNLYEQKKLIDMYLDNPTKDTFEKIINSVGKKDAYQKINNSINKDIKIYKNMLFKNKNK